MFPAHHHCFRAALLLLKALIFLHACSGALSSTGETCYSRQHRDTSVNVLKAQDLQMAIMDVRDIKAERDCILACCSEELKPGIKCNMVMYKPSSLDENCYLFHCDSEEDCPLMSAKPGINTYDIFKGMTHPSAKAKERVTTMPVDVTKQPSTTHSTVKPTTTNPTTTTTSTTQSSTTTSSTTMAISSIAPTELAIILLTMPSEILPTTTSTSTMTRSTNIPYTKSTTPTIHLAEPPQLPPFKLSKKPIRPPKKPEPHGKSNTNLGEIPTPQKQVTQNTIVYITSTTSTTTSKLTTTTPTTTTTTTTTTTAPPTTTTTTTTTPSTTTTTTPSTTTTTTPSTITTTTTTTPSTTTTTKIITTTPSITTTTTSTATNERTTIVLVDMDSDVKNRDSVPAGTSASDKSKKSHLMWKNGLAFLVVLTLIVLTFVVAVVGRRAMESFDRRHYTRLELNDLHYEI